MKNILTFGLILISTFLVAQTENKSEIKMTSDYGSDNSEIRDILQFEGIEYLKLSFTGKNLADKSYHLSVKEIWNGKVKSDSTIMNSKTIKFEQFQKINDSVFNIKIISKLTNDNKLKMTFKFPRFSTSRKFDAIKSEDYSLRNVAEASGTEIKYGEKFYLLAYILPYEKDGAKYWCAVESSGKNIENWGKEFGIKHYLVFEMKFE
ncbi:hypothetical protein [Lacinutrix jangbogonensis]|uniref:hypothetical protein n=1 Tax=Lacinutrix jangbogonensis TaxID=1469557 RepID=UPI00068CD7FB|nr:hypothetical protein [Lacinutrix jangbogonensis]